MTRDVLPPETKNRSDTLLAKALRLKRTQLYAALTAACAAGFVLILLLVHLSALRMGFHSPIDLALLRIAERWSLIVAAMAGGAYVVTSWGRIVTARELAIHSDMRSIVPVLDVLEHGTAAVGRELSDALSDLLLRLDSETASMLPGRPRIQLRGILRRQSSPGGRARSTDRLVIAATHALAAVGDTGSIDVIRSLGNSNASDEIAAAAGRALAILEGRKQTSDVLLRSSTEPQHVGQLGRPSASSVEEQLQLLRSDVTENGSR